MSLWWRAYADARHDPKLMLLSPELFRAWFILVCLAAENDGHIQSVTEAGFALRVSDSKASAIVAMLASKGLLDAVVGGYFEPHNWKQRQYKSDVSTDRVKKFREQRRNTQGNGVETFQKRPQIQKQKEDDVGGDARASPGCAITPEAFALCDELMRLQRLEKDDPRCIASAYAVQAWLTKGWKYEVIRSTVDIVMSKRADAPSALRYFEKAIAAAHAEYDRPLPVAVIQEQTPHVVRKTVRPRGALDAAADLQRRFESGTYSSPDSGAIVSLPPRRLCEP